MRQHSAPALVKCSSGADAMKPTRLIWVGMDILTPEFRGGVPMTTALRS
jgi:hypothetical protein